ncbi:hypothetical protein JCM10212_003769, partial [Sporobolomyces blumeae]
MLRSLLPRLTLPVPLLRPTSHPLRTSQLPRSSFSTSLPRRQAPSDSLSDGEKLLKDKLEQALDGAKVQVQDVSGGCGSFYAISIEHESFRGLNTIKQHRIVNQVLQDEIKGMHGLQ